MVLVVVCARDEKREINSLQKFHFQNVDLLCLNTTYTSIVAVRAESIIEKLDSYHNTKEFTQKCIPYLVIKMR